MRRALVVLALLRFGAAFAADPPGASPFGEAAPVPVSSPFHAEVAAVPESVAAGELAEVGIVLRVPENHYLYAERTSLELLPAAGIEVVETRAPASKTKHDPFLDEDVQVHEHDATFVAVVRVQQNTTLRAIVHSQGCSSKVCFFPQSDTLRIELAVAGAPAASSPTATPRPSSPPPEAAGSGSAEDRLRAAASRGLFWLLLLAFGAGVATSFTPCVYPMIPITIGIIGARSAGRRSKGFTLSLLYVLGIALTYSALGTSAALTGAVFGSVLQNRWVVGGVALVFAAMAMSLFGAFELQVPAAVAGRMNRVQGSGYPGAFLLGLVAGVVASPCIGPVLVAMLAYVAASGSPLLGFALFFAFALGLGLLFIVLGTFTGALASLPKSGGWMVRVRIGFGLLFLALALYYLHPVLPHDRWLVPVGLVLLALGLATGALGAVHETEPAAARWRKSLGRAALAVGLYAAIVPWAGGGRPSGPSAGSAWLASESDGRRLAAAAGRPLLVDFSADWCTACKELEHFTFSDARVVDLARRFVTVRVDATRRTPEIDALMRTYGIVGLPWVAFVTPEGVILHDLTVTGFVDADAMLSRMQGALSGGTAPATGQPGS